jgi:hypothetical protein
VVVEVLQAKGLIWYGAGGEEGNQAVLLAI